MDPVALAADPAVAHRRLMPQRCQRSPPGTQPTGSIVRAGPARRLSAWLLSLLMAAPAGAADGATVTPLPRVVERIGPLAMVSVAPDQWFCDFGADRFANLELDIPHPEPGAQIEVALGEALNAAHRIDAHPGGSVRFLTEPIVLQAGTTRYRMALTPADARRMTPALGAAMPFRYAEISGPPAALCDIAVTQCAVHYPCDDQAGAFSCSDPGLTAVWNLSYATMRATSFAGLFVDGDRERTPYEADAYINQLGWYCCTGDPTLPRWTWEYLIQHATWPTEWQLFAVLMAWTDHRYTGDRAGLSAFYEDLQAKTLIGLERPDGLISSAHGAAYARVLSAVHAPYLRDIVDWPIADRDRYDMRPINTVVNAFHALALARMADIAGTLGRSADAVRFAAAAARTRASLSSVCFDAGTGLYVDGEGSRHSSIHANFFPLAFGLVPPDRVPRIVRFLSQAGMACSVYGAQFLLEALFDHGAGDRALALMTAPGARSWMHMVDAGATMTWEAWDRTDKPNLDWNHAWGAAPANLIARKLLGIEPGEPGFASVVIAPCATHLDWADLRMPTPHGAIHVRIEQAPRAHCQIDLPPGMTGRVGLPPPWAAAGRARLLCDGVAVPVQVTDEVAWVAAIGPGHHDFPSP
jgi:alpha-L-rhamnosidase